MWSPRHLHGLYTDLLLTFSALHLSSPSRPSFQRHIQSHGCSTTRKSLCPPIGLGPGFSQFARGPGSDIGAYGKGSKGASGGDEAGEATCGLWISGLALGGHLAAGWLWLDLLTLL